MRLREIRSPRAGGGEFVIDMHPALTVLTGLTPDARVAVADVIASVIYGRTEGYNGWLELDGTIVDLPQWGSVVGDEFDHLDVFIRPSDLPGAGPGPLSDRRSRLESEVASLSEVVAQAAETVGECRRQVTEAGARLEIASQARTTAEAFLAEVRATGPAPGTQSAAGDDELAALELRQYEASKWLAEAEAAETEAAVTRAAADQRRTDAAEALTAAEARRTRAVDEREQAESDQAAFAVVEAAQRASAQAAADAAADKNSQAERARRAAEAAIKAAEAAEAARQPVLGVAHAPGADASPPRPTERRPGDDPITPEPLNGDTRPKAVAGRASSVAGVKKLDGLADALPFTARHQLRGGPSLTERLRRLRNVSQVEQAKELVARLDRLRAVIGDSDMPDEAQQAEQAHIVETAAAILGSVGVRPPSGDLIAVRKELRRLAATGDEAGAAGGAREVDGNGPPSVAGGEATPTMPAAVGGIHRVEEAALADAARAEAEELGAVARSAEEEAAEASRLAFRVVASLASLGARGAEAESRVAQCREAEHDLDQQRRDARRALAEAVASATQADAESAARRLAREQAAEALAAVHGQAEEVMVRAARRLHEVEELTRARAEREGMAERSAAQSGALELDATHAFERAQQALGEAEDQHRRLLAEVAAAGAEIEALTAREASVLKGPRSDPVSAVDADIYVLSRLANARSVARFGPVPLILVEPLTVLSRKGLRQILGLLERMSSAVQLVYFTEDADVVAWARDLSPNGASVRQFNATAVQ